MRQQLITTQEEVIRL
jgi:hypothetical protein